MPRLFSPCCPDSSLQPATICGLLSSLEPMMLAPLSATVPLVPANAENRYEVTRADLPLSCPMPGMTLWNSHPKVYLPIVDDGGESTCAYCGAHYVLRD
jgi:uncharacterized Zn-finger protein